MDSTFLTYAMLALIGIVYFLLYRFIAFRFLKWKMIHSLWLPLLFAFGFTGFGISLLSTPWFGANRTPLSILGVFVELNFPVISFFICFGLTSIMDKKKN